MRDDTRIRAPFDTRLEEEVIGAMISDPQCIAEVVEKIQPRHFYHAVHQKLCKKIYALWQEDEKKVDLVQMVPFLQQENISVSQITDMVQGLATSAKVAYHADRVKDLAMLRSAIQVGQELSLAGGLREKEEIHAAISRAEAQLAQTTEEQMSVSATATIEDILYDFHSEFEVTMHNQSGITGLSTGIGDLDCMTAGFQKQNLVVLAGRPSMGKTAFALHLAQHISNEGERNPTLFCSLEMSKKDLARRLIGNVGQIDLQNMSTGLINDEEYEKYTMALSILGDANLVIDDQAGVTVSEIKAKARRVKRERGLSCIIIDYLGLIGGDRRMDRYELVSENIRQIKNLAKEFQIPVIVLAQLSRKVEERQNKRPFLSDLRESGEIEQTADLVLFLYRDEYYNPHSEKKRIAELIIAKQRNGPVGTVEMLFMKEYGSFLSMTKR
ncbi:replicative DNA helicase [Marininema mesophilum]|uniref:Replicative DNA helicase n=1 Tax=Marininema mesophilum TaxID=1048340 RepID=A0A1H3BUT3_9BACL|nr:replicative DNA helicase [Marininema mesophilum]SDX45782.1 replicative DNA helicase [Marininema mesophilum]